MVSESYIKRKTEELKKIDVSRNLILIELNYFYGLYDSIRTESYETCTKIEGAYKEFCDTYIQVSDAHSKILHQRLDEGAKWCDKMLKMREGEKNGHSENK